MNRFKIAGCFLIVTLLATTCMVALNTALELPFSPRPRILFIGGGTGERWQRTVAGARAAAQDLGIELLVEAPTSDNLVDQQIAIVRRTNAADYDGVAFFPVNPESQIELINDLAGRTKLVTVGRDCDNSRRLCHVGFCQASAGRMVARLVRGELSRPGKVALWTTTVSDVAVDINVRERLAGFKQEWTSLDGLDASLSCPIIETAVDSKSLELIPQAMSATLADPELALIVAFDTGAAETAVQAFATLPRTRRVPIIAFDPSGAVLDAIDDGRVCSAIFDDPYRDGYAAIERLGVYSRVSAEELPAPGHGSFPLVGEVVRKENLADFRRRTRS